MGETWGRNPQLTLGPCTSLRPRGTRNGATAPRPRSACLPGRGLERGEGGGASGRAFQLQTRLAPRQARFVPPGDGPWAARRAGTRTGDVVASAFPQTPTGGTAGLRGAATRLHVADGNVTTVGKELKPCLVSERCGSQRSSLLFSVGLRVVLSARRATGVGLASPTPRAGRRVGGRELLLPTAL